MHQRMVPPDYTIRKRTPPVPFVYTRSEQQIATHKCSNGDANCILTTMHTPTSLTRLGWSLTMNRTRSSDTCRVSQHHVNSDIATTSDDTIKGINTSRHRNGERRTTLNGVEMTTATEDVGSKRNDEVHAIKGSHPLQRKGLLPMSKSTFAILHSTIPTLLPMTGMENSG